jgi:putative membrane protein
MSEAVAVSPDLGGAQWQRLHPATLALALVKLGPRSLQFLPAVAALGFTGNWVWIVPAILAYLLIALAAACLQWMRFRFIVGDDEVVIESGVLSRQHRTIPFDRIQDVSIEQGLVSRALGIAKVGFETGAGGKENDAHLDAIGLDAAQALRTTIRAHRSAPVAAASVAAEAPAPAPVAEDRLLFAMGPRRLLVAGLFNFSLAALAVVGAGMQFFDDLLPFDFNVFDPRDWIDVAADYGLDQWVLAHRWIAGLGAAISLLFIGFASGIATMVFANWGFRLTREPRALRRTRGLTTRTDVAVPVKRVQAGTSCASKAWRAMARRRRTIRSSPSAGSARSIRCWARSRSVGPMTRRRGSTATASSHWARSSARPPRRSAAASRSISAMTWAGSASSPRRWSR